MVKQHFLTKLTSETSDMAFLPPTFLFKEHCLRKKKGFERDNVF